MANYDLTYEGSEVQGILDTGEKLKADGYILMGGASPSTLPGTPTKRVAYIGGPGTYSNFGSTVVVPSGSIGVFKYDDSQWVCTVISPSVPVSTTVQDNDTTVPTGKAVKTAVDGAVGDETTAREEADAALQGLIDEITDNIENGYVYAGIATPSTTPVTGKVFYIALQGGMYTHFDNTAVMQGINIFKYNGSSWLLDVYTGISDKPIPSGTGLVKAGGTFDFVMDNGSAFDISKFFASGSTLATYENLSAALTDLDGLDAAYKRGGMSIRFVQSSDNKYVQFRYMPDDATTVSTFTNPDNWQGADTKITSGSKNIAESGAVAKEIGDVLIDKTTTINVYEPVNLYPNIIYKMEIKSISADNTGFTFWDSAVTGGTRVETNYLDGSVFTNDTGVTILPHGTYIFTVSEIIKSIRVTTGTSHIIISTFSGLKNKVDGVIGSINGYDITSNLEIGGFAYNDNTHTLVFADVSTQVRTKSSHLLPLKKGDVISLSDYDNFTFYVAYTTGDGKYYRIGSGWRTEDAICPVDGFYAIIFRHSDNSAITVNEIAAIIMVYSGEPDVKLHNRVTDVEQTEEQISKKVEENAKHIDFLGNGYEEIFDEDKVRKGYVIYPNGTIAEDNNFATTDYIPLNPYAVKIEYSGIIASNAIRARFSNTTLDYQEGLVVIMPNPENGEIILTDTMKSYKYVSLNVYRGTTGDIADIDVSNVSIKFIGDNSLKDLYAKEDVLSARISQIEENSGQTEIRLPSFALMFDVGVYDATYLTLLDDLNTLGVKATFAIVPSILSNSNASTFLTRVKNEGHEIAIHSDGSVIDLEATTTKTASEIYQYMSDCISAFESSLSVKPHGLIIAGGHGTNDLVLGEARKLFDYCQGVANYANRSTDVRLPYNTIWFDTMKMMRTNAESDNVLPADVVQEIEQCYDAKGFMVLYGHNYISGGSHQMTAEMLSAICNKLALYGNKVLFDTCYNSLASFCATRHNDIVSLVPELEGKIINYLGDSYIANDATAGNDFYDTWAYKLAEKYHCICRNYGIGGNPMTVERAGTQPMCVRYANMDNDADYVVVVGGKNDYNVQVSISDFKAGVRTLCEGLVAKYVNRKTKICFFTPWRVPQATLDDVGNPATDGITLLNYVDAIVDVCKEYSIPVFDTKNSGIYMFNADFRHNYCQGDSDISHLNAAGHDLFLPRAESFIELL